MELISVILMLFPNGKRDAIKHEISKPFFSCDETFVNVAKNL